MCHLFRKYVARSYQDSVRRTVMYSGAATSSVVEGFVEEVEHLLFQLRVASNRGIIPFIELRWIQQPVIDSQTLVSIDLKTTGKLFCRRVQVGASFPIRFFQPSSILPRNITELTGKRGVIFHSKVVIVPHFVNIGF